MKTYDGNVKYEKITWDVFHGSVRTAWSDSQEEAAGARFTVNSTGLDADKDYEPWGVDYGEDDIGEEVHHSLKYTYDYQGTRVYESLGGRNYTTAKLIQF